MLTEFLGIESLTQRHLPRFGWFAVTLLPFALVLAGKLAMTSHAPPGGSAPHAPTAAVARGLPSTCNLVAAPYGSDRHGKGSLRRPFRGLHRLDRALRPGWTGCLRGGRYGGLGSTFYLTKRGTPTAQITIRSYPGERARVTGFISVDGAYTTLSHLVIDGSNTLYRVQRAESANCPRPVSQALELNGAGDVFEHNDYYQSVLRLRSVGIGIGFGWSTNNVVVRFNRIHDTGQCNNHDHAIYLAHGDRDLIYDNWIWNNRGGQALILYPGATNAQVFNNVIDSSDSGFGLGDDGGAGVAGNHVYHDIVSNSGRVVNKLAGFAFEGPFINCSFGSDSASSGNAIHDDDSFNNPGGGQQYCTGTARASVWGIYRVNPRYVDRAHHNYALRPDSPFASWGMWNGR